MPLILTLGLFAAQLAALAASLRREFWRSTPAWTGYIALATVHLATGLILTLGFRQDYPLSILYLEPLLIVGQIAFTFEASMKYLHRDSDGRSPERRLLLWMIPLIPAAIVLPIEVNFVQEALTNWSSDEGESLKVLYTVRLYLSATLAVVLGVVPMVARLAGKAPSNLVIFHHRILTAYLFCSVFGYISKSYLAGSLDTLVTNTFFLVGPLACFLLWSMRIWRQGKNDLEPLTSGSDHDPIANAYERRNLKTL